MPLGSVLSRNLIRGIVTWPIASVLKIGERSNKTTRVSTAPAFRCVISRSKNEIGKMLAIRGFDDRLLGCCCSKAGPTFDLGGLGGFVNPCPGDCETVCLYLYQLASSPLETSPQGCGPDPYVSSAPGRRSARAFVSVYPDLLPSHRKRQAAGFFPRGK